MKVRIALVLLAALALAGCAKQPVAASPTADLADPPAKKKICANQNGSRIAVCGEGGVGDYNKGESGEGYKEDIGRKLVQRPG